MRYQGQEIIDDYDPVTGEYYYNGKWHDSYPQKEMDDREDERERAREQVERD